MLKLIKKCKDSMLTRELWVKVYVETSKEGQDNDTCSTFADNAVAAYNNKFNELKIKLK